MGISTKLRGIIAARAFELGGSSAVRLFSGAGFPISGTAAAGGTGAGKAGTGSMYFDTTRSTVWVNEGSKTSPYWSPIGTSQAGIWGIDADFREQPGTALTDTGAENVHGGTGLRVFGAGVAVNDAGALAQAAGEGGINLRMTASATNPGVVAIGTEAGVYQPDQHGLAIVEAELTHVSAITLRGMGIGFLGLAADNLAPPITASGTTITLVQDDLALLHFNVGYTAGSRLYFGHNKSDEAASQSTSAGSRDTATDIAAAGTYQRFRVEIGANGSARAFVNKAMVFSGTAILDVDEEASPALYIESTSAAVKSMDVRRFRFLTGRP